MKKLSDYLAQNGRILEAGGNKPFLLDDPKFAYVIQSGKMDVFFVDTARGKAKGRRAHVLRAGEGEALFGLPPGSTGLLAVGTADARLFRIEMSGFLDFVGPGGEEGDANPLIKAWVHGLSKGVERSRLSAPRVKDLETAADLRIKGGSGVPPALRSFHEVFLKCMAADRDKKRVDSQASYQLRIKSDRNRFREALSGLESILRRPGAAPPVVVDKGHSLLAACRMIGRRLNIPIVTPKGTAARQDLEEITRASRLRTREVLLRGEWWRRDNGPLLAFREKDRSPVALIPVSPRRYDLHDPVEGSRRRVDQQEAESLDPHAVSFYQPLPNETLSGKSLLKLGLSNNSRDLLMVLLMGLAGALLGLLGPLMTGIIFDSIIPEAARPQMLQVGFILVVCALSAAMFGTTQAIALIRVEGRMDGTIQAALWDRLLSLPVPFFRRFSAGDLASRSMGINAIRSMLSGMTVTTGLGFVFSTLYLGLLFYYDVSLALMAIGLCFIGFLFIVGSSYFQVVFQRKMLKISGKTAGVILQFLTGITKLRITGSEDRAFTVWADLFSRQRGLAFKSGGIKNALSTFNATFPLMAMMTIFFWIIRKEPTALSAGHFLAFYTAFASFQNAMFQMAGSFAGALNIFPLYERAKPIFKARPEREETKAAPEKFKGEIAVQHVSFRYNPDGPLILKDVSIQVSPGEFVAVVGESGSGKSTLLRMLLGFEQPESGGIYYDRQDLASLDIGETRRQFGVVLQNGQVLPGSFQESILGASRKTRDDAWEAARMVGLAEDIENMPMGMQTAVSSGGSNLSGGQRQRLCIARALVKKPQILFFDEATSSLDNQTQAVVSESLEKLHISRLVIAHRLSTIESADRIYVLQDGQVTQCGTYTELMSREGFFATQAKRQMA